MGVVVNQKIQQFMNEGFSKKEARTKAHEYCENTNTCRGCSSVVRPDWWSWKRGYCKSCID